ncbi:MAG: LamG domain-containing protein, partial [Verrucomicrobiota bacterium]
MKTLFLATGFILLVGVMPMHADCTSPPAGILAWWPGDGNATDLVGGHNGTLTGGAAFLAGRVAQAFSFDGGINSSVDVPDHPVWDLAQDFTIDLWVKINQFGARGEPFIAHDDGGGNHRKWVFWTDSLGHSPPFNQRALRFLVETENDPQDLITYPWNPTLGQWYHVAVTRAGTAFALYIDGVQVN